MGKILPMQFSGEHGSKCKAWFKKKVLFRSSQTWTWRNANWAKDIKAEAHNCPKGLLTFFLLWLELLSLEAFVIVSAKSKPLFDRDLIEKRPQSKTEKNRIGQNRNYWSWPGWAFDKNSWLEAKSIILIGFIAISLWQILSKFFDSTKERFWFEILRIVDSS